MSKTSQTDGRADGLSVADGSLPLNELGECKLAYEIAAHACEERQPMPTEGISPRLIAEACEERGEDAAARKSWNECAAAHRMACWYFRKALDE